MLIAFWVFVILILITYPGYIVFLWVTSRLVRKEVEKKSYLPSVSLIIAAYNEEKVIGERLENSLKLDYPPDLLEIIVASDCSTDDTDRIVKGYQNRGVILSRLDKRGGKTANQNAALKIARGEILVFSDASSFYQPDAIKMIVRSFNDPGVGCAGGKLVFVSEKGKPLVEEKKYYTSFDQALKTHESEIHSIIGVNGPLYAVRKELCRPLPEELTSDLAVPLDVIRQRYRVVYEPEAVSLEEIAPSSKSEFRRKVRTVSAGMNAVYAYRSLLNPIRYFWPAFFLFGHKILRWFFFIFLLGIFICSLFLASKSWFYAVILYFQVIFYLFATIGALVKNRSSMKSLTVPYYFCLYNLASLYGFVRFLFGEKKEVWEVER